MGEGSRKISGRENRKCMSCSVLPDPGAFVYAAESAANAPTLIHPCLRLVDYSVKWFVVFYSFTQQKYTGVQ